MKTLFFIPLLALSGAATAQVGIGTTSPNPATNFEIVGDTVGIRNNATWDNLWFTVDGSAVRINASGAENGMTFRVGANAVGGYGDGQTLTDVMTLKSNGSVGLGTTTPNAGAALDVASTNKAFILPRLSTAAMNAIANPVQGMMVFNTDSGKFFGYGDRKQLSPFVSQPASNATYNQTNVGQTFTAPSNVALNTVEFRAALSGNTAAITLTVALYSGNTPYGTPLASQVVVANDVGVPTRATFPTDVLLQGGSTYTLLLTPSGPLQGQMVGV